MENLAKPKEGKTMTDEKRKAIVIWREALEDVLFCVPPTVRGEVLAELSEIEKERASRDPFAPFVVWTMGDMMKPREADGLFNHIAEATSLIVQVLVRSITNSHSAEDAAKILFREHRHGTGGRWLPAYLRDLPGIKIDIKKAAKISDENGKSKLSFEFPAEAESLKP
jgi:hypothetical protein